MNRQRQEQVDSPADGEVSSQVGVSRPGREQRLKGGHIKSSCPIEDDQRRTLAIVQTRPENEGHNITR